MASSLQERDTFLGTKNNRLQYNIMTFSAVFMLMILIKDSTEISNIVLKDGNFERFKNLGKFIV